MSPVEKKLLALYVAIKTIRKTSLYGHNKSVNIEWPTVGDLLQMANSIPFKMIGLKYQKSTTHSKFFGAFQVILSNGMSSPVFNSKNTNG